MAVALRSSSTPTVSPGWLGVTPAWVYAETRAGRLPHISVGRYYRYRPSSIEKWLSEQERR